MTNREPWRVSTKNGLDSTYPVVNGFQIPIYAVVSSWQPVVVEPHADFGSLADSQHTVRILFDRISAHD